MDYTIINEINKCRGKPIVGAEKINTNRFRLVCRDAERELSVYYFSCPIYRNIDNKLISFNFEHIGDIFVFNGINANVRVGQHCTLTNMVGKIELQELEIIKAQIITTKDMYGDLREALFFKNCEEQILIFPTCNGIAVQITTTNLYKMRKFRLLTDKKYYIWGNGRYAALMIEDRQPFAVVNAMCRGMDNGDSFVPIYCYLEEEKDGYSLIIDLGSPTDFQGSKQTYIFTLDLYTSKSIFDTTVESVNPDMNNSYGSLALIGNSKFFGEQWLYTRIDAAQLLDLRYFSVISAKLYAKKYSGGDANVNINKMNIPWCSFGNTWNTKTETEELVGQAKSEQGYLVADLTKIIRKILYQNGEPDAGVVLKPVNINQNAVMTATADNYFTPQILEIKLSID